MEMDGNVWWIIKWLVSSILPRWQLCHPSMCCVWYNCSKVISERIGVRTPSVRWIFANAPFPEMLLAKSDNGSLSLASNHLLSIRLIIPEQWAPPYWSSLPTRCTYSFSPTNRFISASMRLEYIISNPPGAWDHQWHLQMVKSAIFILHPTHWPVIVKDAVWSVATLQFVPEGGHQPKRDIYRWKWQNWRGIKRPGGEIPVKRMPDNEQSSKAFHCC